MTGNSVVVVVSLSPYLSFSLLSRPCHSIFKRSIKNYISHQIDSHLKKYLDFDILSLRKLFNMHHSFEKIFE